MFKKNQQRGIRLSYLPQIIWFFFLRSYIYTYVFSFIHIYIIFFSFIPRVGLNFGDVTAGVIGTTKLYYDIWGDGKYIPIYATLLFKIHMYKKYLTIFFTAVNIASRMESTGVQGRIQVPERCMHVLSEWYTFELRGSIFVKGKDNMTTFLLVGRKPDSMVNAVTSIKPVLS